MVVDFDQATALGLQLVSAFWFFKIVRMLTLKVKRHGNLKAAAGGLRPPLKAD